MTFPTRLPFLGKPIPFCIVMGWSTSTGKRGFYLVFWGVMAPPAKFSGLLRLFAFSKFDRFFDRLPKDTDDLLTGPWHTVQGFFEKTQIG